MLARCRSFCYRSSPLSPGKLWRLLDDESTPPLPDQLFDRHSSSIDQNVFSSDSCRFLQGSLLD